VCHRTPRTDQAQRRDRATERHYRKRVWPFEWPRAGVFIGGAGAGSRRVSAAIECRRPRDNPQAEASAAEPAVEPLGIPMIGACAS
jgi:hypothetical protein